MNLLPNEVETDRVKRGGKTRRFFSALAAAVLTSISVTASAEPVSRVEISGLSTLGETAVRDVINMRPGDEFSLEALDDAISNLRKWGVFDAIEVEPSAEPDGVLVRFRLEEATVVVSIDVAGNYPYIENKVKKHLTLHPGDIYTPERVADQIERIKAFYAREGYVGTEAYVEEEMMPEWGGVVLTFHIRRGMSLRYRTIEVEGNEAFPDGRFVSMMKTWRQYSDRRLSDSVRRIREFYHEKGWPRARVRVKNKKIDFDEGRVDVTLEVNEGPHVAIVFTGGGRIDRKVLRRTITVLKEGSIDNYEIQRSSEAIEELLRIRGYPDASVKGSREDRKDGSILISFSIDEGKPAKIRHLNFSGAKNVDESDLSKGMINRKTSFSRTGAYMPEEEARDREAIETALHSRGFLGSSVGEWRVEPSPQGFALDLTIPIVEGPQTIVGEIDFLGDIPFRHGRILKVLKIKPDRPLNEPGLEDDRQRVITFFADHGYPYAEVKQDWHQMPDGRAVISYTVDAGKKVTIGHILIVGDVLTSQRAIKRAMSAKEGEPFSYRKIIESQQSIRRLGAFAAVGIETIGLERKEDTVHLRVKVEEQRPFMVDLGIAYSTDESLTGTFTFTNLNAFGWAKQNTLRLIGGEKLSRMEIGWFDPRFLSSSFEMSTIAWVQYHKQPSYAYTQAGGALSWFRRLRRFNFFFRWELDRNYFVSGDSVAADADSLRNSTISRIALSSSFDNRDSFSDPRRGFFTLGGVDIYNEIKGAEANFVKFQWQGENDLSPFDWITLATSLRFNQIVTIGKNVSVPTNELLFMGGSDTVRGYAYQSLGPANAAGEATGGRIRWIWNEELRFRLARSLQWAFFLDMGSLTDSYSAISWRNTVRRSLGFGLRYMTPVGPIRADYGIKLDRKTGESFGQFHFTFGYVF